MHAQYDKLFDTVTADRSFAGDCDLSSTPVAELTGELSLDYFISSAAAVAKEALRHGYTVSLVPPMRDSMKTRCKRATELFPECGADRVAPGAALLALGGDIHHVLDADAAVATVGQASESEYAVLAKPVDGTDG